MVSAGIDAVSLEKRQRRRSIEMKAIKVAEKQASRKAHRTKRIRALYRAKTEKEMNKQSAQMGNAPSEDNWVALTDPDSGDTYYWNEVTNESRLKGTRF